MAGQVAPPGDQGQPPQAEADGQPSGQPGEPGRVSVSPEGAALPLRRSRKRGAITLAVAAVVVIGAAACGSSSPPTSAGSPAAAASPATAAGGLHFPARLFGLSKNTGPAARAVIRSFVSLLAPYRSAFRSSQEAVYGNVSGPPTIMVFVATLTSAGARRAAVPAFDKKAAVASVKGASGAAQPFPAGPHGGALECGQRTRSGARSIVCGWTDKVTYGGVFYFGGSASSLSQAAAKTNQVRSVIEP
jgi:hypothetical protein